MTDGGQETGSATESATETGDRTGERAPPGEGSDLTDSAESPAEAVVTVEDLDHSFGDVSVLEGVSFDLSPGTVTALVGPNGSGKTTLLRIVAGLLAPTGGRVDRPEGTRAIGYLPQNPGFRPSFTVAETLSFYGTLLGGEDVEAALETVGLDGVADRRVDALSGGMVRLLGIAQATLGDPDLVVLDEPTGDLDPAMTEYVFEVVEGLAEGGTAVLLATHDLAGAEHADGLLVLDRGSIVDRGTPGEVVESAGVDSLTDAFLAHVGAEEGLSVRASMDPAAIGSAGDDHASDGGDGE